MMKKLLKTFLAATGALWLGRQLDEKAGKKGGGPTRKT